MECGQFRAALASSLRLPSAILTEDRVSPMNDFWDLTENRDVMVVTIGLARETYADTGALVTLLAI